MRIASNRTTHDSSSISHVDRNTKNIRFSSEEKARNSESKASAALSQAIGSNSLLHACIKQHVSKASGFWQQASMVEQLKHAVLHTLSGESISDTRFQHSLLRHYM